MKRERKLSTKLAVISGIVLVIIFVILISIVATITSTSLSAAIESAFEAYTERSDIIVEDTAATAVRIASDIENSLNDFYAHNFSDNVISTDEGNYRKSKIFDIEIPSECYDLEDYILYTGKYGMIENEDLFGIGVMLEPYAFCENVESYAFNIDRSNMKSDKIESYGDYAEYSKDTYYTEAIKAGKSTFTQPFEYNGEIITTYTTPIFRDGDFKGVVTIDIKLDTFSKAVTVNSNYPSMYTTIYRQVDDNCIIMYDSEDKEDIGQKMSQFYAFPEEFERTKEHLLERKAFTIKTHRENGTEITRYFSPADVGGEEWWTMTALYTRERNKDITRLITYLIVISLISLIVILSVIIYALRRSLKPINNVVKSAQDISVGNLNINLSSTSNDEIGKLAHVFNDTANKLRAIIGDINYQLSEMAEGNFDISSKNEAYYTGEYSNILVSIKKLNVTLSDTLKQINDSSSQVSLGASQLSDSAQNLALGAIKQAGEVESLSSTIENITSIVVESAENADKAYNQAIEYEQKATESKHQMEDLMKAMININKSSQKIADIIDEIDTIASKTSLLALNASVEAARVGTAGRGFAVVAENIGKLAEDSSKSSVSTRELIESAIAEIKSGNKIAETTKISLEEVVEGIKVLGESSKSVSEASTIQAGSMKDINSGIEEIAGVAQNNSAVAEETSATSEELSAQSAVLNDLVRKFKLKKF